MSNNRKLKEYSDFSKFLKKFLGFVGLWPRGDPTYFYRLSPYIPVVACLNAIIVIVNGVGHNLGNLRLVTLRLSIMVAYLVCILKVVCLLTNFKRLVWFNQTLKHLSDEFVEDKILTNIISIDVRMVRRGSYLFLFLSSLSSSLPVITPLISIVDAQIHKVYPSRHPLVIPGMYPWNATINNYVYVIHYVAETYTLLGCFFVGGLVDVLFSFFVLQMTVSLRGMSHRLLSATDEHHYKDTLYKCIVQYDKLIKCRNILQETYGPIILFVAGTGPIALCSLIWQITQSEDYLLSAYSSAWLGDKTIMYTILMIMSQKPLTVASGHMPDVSLTLFLFVAKTTMSYYLLLQTISQK